jgi:hypothetical protein
MTAMQRAAHSTGRLDAPLTLLLCVRLSGSGVAQKFRFCGEQDAPDWILAEVSVLSKMVREVDSGVMGCRWLR